MTGTEPEPPAPSSPWSPAAPSTPESPDPEITAVGPPVAALAHAQRRALIVVAAELARPRAGRASGSRKRQRATQRTVPPVGLEPTLRRF